jgi:hypothetical protein
MSEELIGSIQKKVDQHDREIIEIRSFSRDMIESQKSSTKAIQDLVVTLQQYMVKHDHVAAQSSELSKDVRALREQAAANQPMIDSIRNFGGKISWLLVSTLLSPAAIAALFAFGGK